MAPFLEVKNLTHIYSAGTPFEHKALDSVSFCMERGEFVGVIGHTGSGKSTLMQHLNGLLKPSSGSIICMTYVYLCRHSKSHFLPLQKVILQNGKQ